MSISRKQFLQQSAFAMAGACLPFTKLLAKSNTSFRVTKDIYHPLDCKTIDPASSDPVLGYFYDATEIKQYNGFYSLGTVNPNYNDVVYQLEGDYPDIETCNPSVNSCTNLDFQNANPFRYTAYYPDYNLHDYAQKPLPVVILFHAGGFQECSTYGDTIITTLCMELARKAYICISVEYRRGRIIDFTNYPNIQVSVQQQFARYRGIQDGCGAISSIIKQNRDGIFSSKFVIDESQVFIGGDSAGGIIALGCAYYHRTSTDFLNDQAMIDMVFPKSSPSGYDIKDVLGNMHENYYYAPAEVQYWPIIRGVISMWGGFVIPKTYDGAMNETDFAAIEKTYFQLNNPGFYDNPPLICFHGGNDTTIPFKDNSAQDMDLSLFNGSASDDYQSENSCTISGRTYKQFVYPDPTRVELKICSSLNLYLVMRQLNRFSEFYLDCTMAHGLDDDCITCNDMSNRKFDRNNNCVPCSYTSAFGTAATNQQQTVVYMGQRIAIFLREIMVNSSIVLTFTCTCRGRSYFKDCENFRTCFNGGAENNACGSGNTLCTGETLF